MALYSFLPRPYEPLRGNEELKAKSCSCGSRLLNNRMLHSPESRGSPCRYVDLVVNVLNVVIRSFRRDVEPVGDLLRRQSPRRKPQHIRSEEHTSELQSLRHL